MKSSLLDAKYYLPSIQSDKGNLRFRCELLNVGWLFRLIEWKDCFRFPSYDKKEEVASMSQRTLLLRESSVLLATQVISNDPRISGRHRRSLYDR